MVLIRTVAKLVYDLAGVLTTGYIEDDIFEVLAASGDTHLDIQEEDWRRCYQNAMRLEIESFEGGNDFSETLTRANIKKDGIHDVVLVAGSTRIPKVQQLLKEYCGKEPSKSTNLDETVTYDAVLSGEEGTENLVLVDVCPLAPGIETTVYGGKHAMTKVTGIPPAPRGVPQIEVTFEIDANSILTVAVIVKGTYVLIFCILDPYCINKTLMFSDREQQRLSQDDVKRMIREVEEFTSEDEAQRKRAEVLNSLSSEDKKEILAAIKETNDWLESNGQSASAEGLEEKLSGKCSFRMCGGMSTVISPLASKSYGGGGTKSHAREEDEEEFDDEL
ncbi:hypothetical protein Clacol_007003 [Clathrus columnatus]|uniref:Heat shock protein 70 n=1 Tax=Clathrus columnatus TaxID=1419009 RepID=A0AAV5AI21_9AGAM|nr:hypothetical protein Clacol_007003 [Clathrus columnatus]